ncbi:hypothetical protein, partial [Pararhizobium haloflavum]|uniref:hypothetical protein n=1 Tax=Pararhizobium haloflavum TaxID=2037914 RepID=UPI001AECA6CC
GAYKALTNEGGGAACGARLLPLNWLDLMLRCLVLIFWKGAFATFDIGLRDWLLGWFWAETGSVCFSVCFLTIE